MALTIVIVFQSLEGEFSQEIKEFIVKLGLRYLLDKLLKFVNESDVNLRDKVLNGAVYHPNHLFMFA